MDKSVLKEWLELWGLSPTDGAQVLKIQKSKMSEYLGEKRELPPYIAAHVETFNALPKGKGQQLIAKRVVNKSKKEKRRP